MPKRMSNRGEHNCTSLLGGLKDLMNALTADLGLSKPKEHNTSPFGDALRETSEYEDGIIDELARHAVALSPVVKRCTSSELESIPEGLMSEWAQLPFIRDHGFSLGILPDRDHSAQVVFADTRSRVSVGTSPDMDVQDMQARFISSKEKEVILSDGERLGENDEPRSRSDFSRADRDLGSAPHHGHDLRCGLGHGVDDVRAITGGVVGRDNTGRMAWFASRLKAGDRYTLEQIRANLPPAIRHDLECRDIIIIAFFATYMLPQVNGLLIGFDPDNTFRRLNREASVGTIRCSVYDTLAVRTCGMRASSLRNYFADLMHEISALDTTPGPEAVHGAEPLHLYTSTYSSGYSFMWDRFLVFRQALRSLKIEGNLNRLAAVNVWLEHNASLGRNPTEDTVIRARAT